VLKRCCSCRGLIGPAQLIAATGGRLSCPSCWALMKTNGSRPFRIGMATGIVVLAITYFALGEKGWQIFRIALLPAALGTFAAKFFPSVTLDDDGRQSDVSKREDPLQVSGHIVNTRPSGTKPR
jgi:hypothetical protein